MRGNLSGDLTAAFVAPDEGNLRLTAAATDAIDKAVALPEVTTDIDRKPRGAVPDLGCPRVSRPLTFPGARSGNTSVGDRAQRDRDSQG